MHRLLIAALEALKKNMAVFPEDSVILSERGLPMRASSMVNWFQHLYQSLAFSGCSSHSGRRTFVTVASQKVSLAGDSLRDVQQ